MGVLQELRQWYRLNYGAGKQMLDEGAEVAACPHCEEETPVFPSTYDDRGNPVTFSVCLWCDGLIEHGGPGGGPRPPFTTPRELATPPHRHPPRRPRPHAAPDGRVRTAATPRSPRRAGSFVTSSHVFDHPRVRF